MSFILYLPSLLYKIQHSFKQKFTNLDRETLLHDFSNSEIQTIQIPTVQFLKND